MHNLSEESDLLCSILQCCCTTAVNVIEQNKGMIMIYGTVK